MQKNGQQYRVPRNKYFQNHILDLKRHDFFLIILFIYFEFLRALATHMGCFSRDNHNYAIYEVNLLHIT